MQRDQQAAGSDSLYEEEPILREEREVRRSSKLANNPGVCARVEILQELTAP